MLTPKYIAVVASLLILALSGCTSGTPRALSTKGTPYAALVNGKDPINPDRFVIKQGAVYASEEDLFRYYEKERGHALNILLHSGGGQNAFGAGMLAGWRKAGTRPEFDMVTGVSTGALLATHAFLGTPADDRVLEKIFTEVKAGNIYTERSIFSILGGASSLLETDPLKELIARYVTQEVLDRVAAEHAKGRRLWVGATNLDYAQTWAWNLSLIAAEGGPGALELYRKVLRASSAFPIMFPPVKINGHLFADGAVRANILPVGLSGEHPPGPPLFGPGAVLPQARQATAMTGQDFMALAVAKRLYSDLLELFIRRLRQRLHVDGVDTEAWKL